MTRTYRTGLKSLMASTGALFLAGCATIETPAHATSEQSEPYTVHALMTDDHDIYIDAPPDVAWQEIKRLYVEGDRYRSYGNEIVDIGDDPKAFMGGYKAVPEQGKDGRSGTFRFSDIDNEKRFLALSIDADGLERITVSHRILPEGSGSRYMVIINAFFPVKSEGQDMPTKAYVAERMAALLEDHHEGLADIMETVKQEIELAASKDD